MADQVKAGFVGRSRNRCEDKRLLTGQEPCIADLAPPHMLHAAFGTRMTRGNGA